MDLVKYKDEIRDAAYGELVGEAFYQRFASNFSSEHREKFKVLERLEAATADKMEFLLKKYDIQSGDAKVLTAMADKEVAQYAGLSWLEFLEQFRVAITPYVDKYNRLEEQALPEDLPALAYLAEHERALMTFLEMELAGAPDTLADVRVLLSK